MSEQPQRPTSDDHAAWGTYWQAQGMPWRIEPEIDEERQQFLAERRAVPPDIERGIYPFRDENGSIRLYRADIEWLLATHEDGRGPVDWRDERQHGRKGLDLRGANVRAADLHALPLARLVGALAHTEAYGEGDHRVPRQRRFQAALYAEGADLSDASLEGSQLGRVRFQDADLSRADLRGADLFAAHLEGVNLTDAILAGAILRDAYFDRSSYLDKTLNSDARHGAFRVLDTRWGGVNLGTIDWQLVPMLGEERKARESHWVTGKRKDSSDRIREFDRAVRTNRQVAIALRGQGISEQADRFAYRAQRLRRQVLWRQGHWLRYLGSLLLDLISGYGYRPMRSLLTYLLVVMGFAVTYHRIGANVRPPLSFVDAIVFSITSFHGRGFSPGEMVTLHNPLSILAAGEAIIGLLIEITFIATFTQRFFAR